MSDPGPSPTIGITGTSHVVRASACEAYGIWHRWSHVYGVEIRQETTTMRQVIGRVDGRPIEVRVTWYVVGARRVAFVDPISDLVDWPMVDAWARQRFFPDLDAAEALRRIFDAADFQIVLAQIFAEEGKRIPMRDLVEIDRAIANVPIQEE